MKISSYNGPVKGLNTGGPGRKPSAETLELQAAIEASARDGKARRWEGGAKEYKKNGQRVRVVGHNHTTKEAPLGFSLRVGLDGDDLTFVAKVKVEKEEAATETPAETPAPAPAPKPAAKPKAAAPAKATPTPRKSAPKASR